MDITWESETTISRLLLDNETVTYDRIGDGVPIDCIVVGQFVLSDIVNKFIKLNVVV